MFALGIHYLNGWTLAAADGAKKERAEWPPHPDRIFMALAAAWFETGEDPLEGEVLRWLESLPPPSMSASDASHRHAWQSERPVVSYVPVNDSQRGRNLPDSSEMKKLKEAGLALLSEYRPRQPRSFPVAVPERPNVYLVWPEADAAPFQTALIRLCEKVTHVGHSASLVQMWFEASPPEVNLIPVTRQSIHRLRVAGAGRLQYLEQRCNRSAVIEYADLQAQMGDAKGKEKKRLKSAMADRFGSSIPVSLRPEPGLWQGYGKPEVEKPCRLGTVFDDRLLVFALTGKRLSLPATLKLTETMRNTLMRLCPQPIPEWVSGHTLDGAPSPLPHLAVIPMPFVDHAHADGRLMGVALVLPKAVDQSEVARCLGSLLHDEDGLIKRTKLFDGPWLECVVELEIRDTPPASLLADLWTRPSRTWASVTPVALDRHFDGKDKWQLAAESVKDSCERIGLPRPREVMLHPVSLVEGVPHSRDFPYIVRKKDGGRRHHAHAVIVFDEEVQGPLLIGAGRFRGYGLCRPMDQGASHE
ncbi:MAG: type I-G CRISPR-associated protein Csb2 [Pseudomonadota bacterium]